MPNLLGAKETPCFRMYDAWMDLGTDGTLKNSISNGLRQPDVMTVSFTIGSNQNAKEHKFFIIPNQVKNGVEWTLTYMFLGFIKKVLPCFTATECEEPSFQAMLVQGNVLISWCMVIAKYFDTNEKRIKQILLKEQTHCTLRVL
jgi:hypothetical protein